MNDQPIAHTADGRPIFDNTPTVVVVLADFDGKLLAIRRNNEPGRGFIGLPGGYHMRGETWQEAGLRELREETGYTAKVEDVRPYGHVVTDEYGNNLIFARIHRAQPPEDPFEEPVEVQEVLLLERMGEPEDWAFPRHWAQGRSVLNFVRAWEA